LTIYDDGAQIRAWCYVTDCLNGLEIITQKGSGIYNIGNPIEALTSVGLAKLIIEIANSKSKLIFKPLNSSDVKVRVPNIKKLSSIGYTPKISLREGIAKTIDWYKSINS
jgi:nucleoside-diphosphate-sugar epimerase